MMEAEDSSVPVFKYTDRHLWGLDYLFRTFNMMYIKDILECEKYPVIEGTFAYKDHPIFKVDIVGVVVRVEERSKLFMYGVDDGTGVISCTCWKNEDNKFSDTAEKLNNLPTSLHTKAKEIERNKLVQYELGDLVNIRGKIKVFRDRKEISASYHIKIDNPAAEVKRMMMLPVLYRVNYDKPFKLPYKVRQYLEIQAKEKETGQKSKSSIIKELSDLIKTYLMRTSSFHLVTVEELTSLPQIQTVLKQNCHFSNSDSLVACSLKYIEEENGWLCHRQDKNSYEILLNECQLDKLILEIVTRETKKKQYSDRGVHEFFLLEEVHQTYEYSKLHRTAFVYCLRKLETNSDIIRTTQQHYLPCLS